MGEHGLRLANSLLLIMKEVYELAMVTLESGCDVGELVFEGFLRHIVDVVGALGFL